MVVDTSELKVHPAAEAFPMMSDAELADLAADIKANGLNQPLMLDAAGEVLLDGRNRLKACGMAGVVPHFDRLPKDRDPIRYIVSQNIERRHLSKGQQAIALAMIYPDPENKGGRGNKRSFLEETVSRAGLSRARKVLRVTPWLARQVTDGSLSLETAYATAREFEDELRKNDPDLAGKLDAGEISEDEAFAVFHIRLAHVRFRLGMMEIGRELTEVRERIGDDRVWCHWLSQFGWSDEIARRFMAFSADDENQIDEELAQALLKCVEPK